MSLLLEPAAQRLVSSYGSGNPLVLLFDYDGTLVPIVEHPRLARLDRGARRLLAELARFPDVHIAIVSARMLDEVKLVTCLPEACFAGTCGLELEIQGVRVAHPRAREATQLLTRLVPRLQAELRSFPGAWLENKQLGLTIHYRNVPSDLASGLCCRVRKVLELQGTELRVVDGPKALEVMPELGWNKGTAVQLLVHRLGAGSTGIIYAGDSANDAEALEAVRQLGGIAIGVGPLAPPTAQYRVSTPAALLDFVRELKDALSRERALGAVREAREFRRSDIMGEGL